MGAPSTQRDAVIAAATAKLGGVAAPCPVQSRSAADAVIEALLDGLCLDANPMADTTQASDAVAAVTADLRGAISQHGWAAAALDPQHSRAVEVAPAGVRQGEEGECGDDDVPDMEEVEQQEAPKQASTCKQEQRHELHVNSCQQEKGQQQQQQQQNGTQWQEEQPEDAQLTPAASMNPDQLPAIMQVRCGEACEGTAAAPGLSHDSWHSAAEGSLFHSAQSSLPASSSMFRSAHSIALPSTHSSMYTSKVLDAVDAKVAVCEHVLAPGHVADAPPAQRQQPPPPQQQQQQRQQQQPQQQQQQSIMLLEGAPLHTNYSTLLRAPPESGASQHAHACDAIGSTPSHLAAVAAAIAPASDITPSATVPLSVLVRGAAASSSALRESELEDLALTRMLPPPLSPQELAAAQAVARAASALDESLLLGCALPPRWRRMQQQRSGNATAAAAAVAAAAANAVPFGGAHAHPSPAAAYYAQHQQQQRQSQLPPPQQQQRRASQDGSPGSEEEGVLVEVTPDMPQSVEELEDAQWPGLCYCDGCDSHGRPIVIINTDTTPFGSSSGGGSDGGSGLRQRLLSAAAAAAGAGGTSPRDAAFAYLLRRLAPLACAGPYVLVFVAVGPRPARFRLLPALWCVRAYRSLPRAYRKHVRHVLLVQPPLAVRGALAVVRPFVSPKAHAKVKQVDSLLGIDHATRGEVQVAHLGERFLTAMQQLRGDGGGWT